MIQAFMSAVIECIQMLDHFDYSTEKALTISSERYRFHWTISSQHKCNDIKRPNYFDYSTMISDFSFIGKVGFFKSFTISVINNLLWTNDQYQIHSQQLQRAIILRSCTDKNSDSNNFPVAIAISKDGEEKIKLSSNEINASSSSGAVFNDNCYFNARRKCSGTVVSRTRSFSSTKSKRKPRSMFYCTMMMNSANSSGIDNGDQFSIMNRGGIHPPPNRSLCLSNNNKSSKKRCQICNDNHTRFHDNSHLQSSNQQRRSFLKLDAFNHLASISTEEFK
ncbi:hypothetical protein GJ496_011161 [Pomphorhynchus laevis]|nr:hypothetical protein GJ496_011161 [Pomphorhynchus laevis]